MTRDPSLQFLLSARSRLTSTERRRAATVCCVVAVVAVFLLAMSVDVRVAAWVHEPPFPPAVKAVFRWLRLPGHYGFTAVLAATIVWPFRRHWRVAAAVLIAGASSSAVTGILKYCFGRNRPFRGRSAFDWLPFPGSPLDSTITRDLSFPSGDATLAFATATVIAYAFPRLRSVAWGWAVVVAMTRVLQGAHYPSDAVGGAVVGVVFGRLACRLLRRDDLLPAGRK